MMNRSLMVSLGLGLALALTGCSDGGEKDSGHDHKQLSLQNCLMRCAPSTTCGSATPRPGPLRCNRMARSWQGVSSALPQRWSDSSLTEPLIEISGTTHKACSMAASGILKSKTQEKYFSRVLLKISTGLWGHNFSHDSTPMALQIGHSTRT